MNTQQDTYTLTLLPFQRVHRPEVSQWFEESHYKPEVGKVQKTRDWAELEAEGALEGLDLAKAQARYMAYVEHVRRLKAERIKERSLLKA